MPATPGQRRRSSAVLAITYDAAARELTVTYVGGRRYAYADVPDRVYRQFRSAESLGRFVNAVIKPRYPCREIVRAAALSRTAPPGRASDRRRASRRSSSRQ
jgi:hypothetical protein